MTEHRAGIWKYGRQMTSLERQCRSTELDLEAWQTLDAFGATIMTSADTGNTPQRRPRHRRHDIGVAVACHSSVAHQRQRVDGANEL